LKYPKTITTNRREIDDEIRKRKNSICFYWLSLKTLIIPSAVPNVVLKSENNSFPVFLTGVKIRSPTFWKHLNCGRLQYWYLDIHRIK
jgi:hypothetical protein